MRETLKKKKVSESVYMRAPVHKTEPSYIFTLVFLSFSFSAFASHAGVLYMEVFNSNIGGLMQLFSLKCFLPIFPHVLMAWTAWIIFRFRDMKVRPFTPPSFEK
jgi:hypothetical protein